MSTPRIYVACLASYNAGRLHGRWIDAADADTMREEIAEILRASPFPNVTICCPDCAGNAYIGGDPADPIACPSCNGSGEVPSAEEYAVHDYDGLPSSFGEYPDLDTIAAYVEAVEEHGEAFAVWWANESRDDVDVSAFQDAYQGTFNTLADWAESFLEDTGGLAEVPEHLARYFDFEAYANDARRGGDIWSDRGESGDLHVFWNH